MTSYPTTYKAADGRSALITRHRAGGYAAKGSLVPAGWTAHYYHGVWHLTKAHQHVTVGALAGARGAVEGL